MRAILIDAENRTIREIQVKADSVVHIHAALGCRKFPTGPHPLADPMEESFDALYVSNVDPADAGDPARFWFSVYADHDPPSSHPGPRGLVVGIDKEGKRCDARISVAELTRRVTFTVLLSTDIEELHAKLQNLTLGYDDAVVYGALKCLVARFDDERRAINAAYAAAGSERQHET